MLSFNFLAEGRFTSRNNFNVLLNTPSDMSLQFSKASSALSKGFALNNRITTYNKSFQFDKLTELLEIRNTLLYLKDQNHHTYFT